MTTNTAAMGTSLKLAIFQKKGNSVAIVFGYRNSDALTIQSKFVC